jgi:hypothetical protein
MTQPSQPSLTSREMGDQWHVSPETAVRWAQQGLAVAIRTPGGHWRFFGPLPSPPSPSPSCTEGQADAQ